MWQNIPSFVQLLSQLYKFFSSLYKMEFLLRHRYYILSKKKNTLNVVIWNTNLQTCNLIFVISSAFPLKKLIQELKGAFLFVVYLFFSHLNCINYL